MCNWWEDWTDGDDMPEPLSREEWEVLAAYHDEEEQQALYKRIDISLDTLDIQPITVDVHVVKL